MSAISVVAGIDVAKAHVDVDVVGATFAAQRFDNEAEGHSAIASALKTLGTSLVVLEATGGYEAALACALQGAGLAVAVVNPRQPEFGQTLIRRPDLSRFLRPMDDAEQQWLAALVTRRRQLVAMMTSERQRLQITPKKLHPSLEAIIQAIKAQLDDVEAQMVAHVKERFGALDSILQSVSGIGPVASATLIAELARAGQTQPPTDRLSGGRGALRQGFRYGQGPTPGAGRALRCAACALHGHAHGRLPQSGLQGLLPAPDRGRQAAQGGPCSLHAQAADHAQCHGQIR